MTKELIIHLGDTKTGSTSIQQALVNGACELPGKSYYFPTHSNHNLLAHSLTQKTRLNEQPARFKRIAKALDQSDADFGVISAEHFQFVRPKVLLEAIETYLPAYKDNMRLVAYVRPHPEKILSAFSERLKLGEEIKSVPAFFERTSKRGIFLYHPRFKRWRNIFGDRFELRPFARSYLHDQDVVSDFFHFMLGTSDFELAKTVNANTSLTLGQLALQREVQLILRDTLKGLEDMRYDEARTAIGRLLAEYMRTGDLGARDDKLLIPASLVGPIQKFYAADAEAMDADFFEGTPMTDALAKMDDKTIDTPQSLEAKDHFSKETIEAFHIFSRMLGDMVRLRPQRLRETLTETRRHLGLS
ncbi:hypothetical protein [Shimia aestuarii]|uniref:hypothetical protein n=1 Tax=Shimia aestuarii TaxID=254406 RepID=UPI001FB1CA3C|nr:hypothetical protein [Shimia aestuarii]